MPESWQKLEKENRGFPKPIFLITRDGECDFRGMDARVVHDLARNRLCGICGDPLRYWIAFVGGPMSTKNRVYTDPPFHPECARAAIRICPYMLYGGWDRNKVKRVEDAKKDDPWGNADRVTHNAILITRQFQIIFPGGTMLFRARPAKEIEWYERGQRVETGPLDGGQDQPVQVPAALSTDADGAG